MKKVDYDVHMEDVFMHSVKDLAYGQRESERARGRETEGEREREGGGLVNWCFEPSQPLRNISGLKETFIKRHTVERTIKAEIRPKEQIEKTESCRKNLWNEIQLRGP